MIPLELRSNKLISIMIRAFDLEYTNYKLEVIGSNNTSIISKETLKTIVKKDLKKMPKFEIDRNQNELSKYLLSTSNCKMQIKLSDIQIYIEKERRKYRRIYCRHV